VARLHKRMQASGARLIGLDRFPQCLLGCDTDNQATHKLLQDMRMFRMCLLLRTV
jgi:hypothetical protein